MREEIPVSIEFDLPLTVVLDLNIRGISGGGDLRVMRRALDVLRVADLVARPSPEELLVALPNTTPDDARVAEERLCEVVPEASSGVTTCREGDTVEDLLQRACRPTALCGLSLAALLIVRAQRPVELAGGIF